MNQDPNVDVDVVVVVDHVNDHDSLTTCGAVGRN
jgi:hypothetical protein